MPIARVQMPDGRIGRFDVPEGMSSQDIEALAISHPDTQPAEDASTQSFFHTPESAQEQQIAKEQNRAALEQGLQGATFGFGDEIAGTLGGLGAKAYDALTGQNLFQGQSPGDVAQQGRELAAKQIKTEQQNYPALSVGSNLAGGLLTGGAGAETAGGAALANSLRTGNVAMRAAKGAIAGAASGGLYGAGTAEQGQELQGAEQGAIGGAILGGALPIVGATMGAVKNAILPVANENIKPLAQKAIDYGIPLSRTQIGE